MMLSVFAGPKTLLSMQFTRFITIIFFLPISFIATGQKIYNNWYFGEFAGATFNTNPPTILTDGQMNTLEGCATISDNAGNLLFYSDGMTVWDRDHHIMPHGTGLTGSETTAQSALIVPFPGDASKYYLFTLGDATIVSDGELRYSVVDMNLNNGLGDVIPSQRNIVLTKNLTEKLISANSGDCNIWVITHQRNNNRFEARLITKSGIAAPVFSNAGAIHSADPPNGDNGLTGVMKVSKNNLKIGVANLQRVIEVLDFDPVTGIVSNPVSLPMAAPNVGYGVCFSPDNSKFYITEGHGFAEGFKIYQYDLSSGDAATIINSRKLLGDVIVPHYYIADMQIGPDNRIYIAEPETNYLGIIPDPDLTAPLCGFDTHGLFLGTGISTAGFPNEIRYSADFIQVNLGHDTTLCAGNVLKLSAPNAVSYHWSTGATSQNINVSATGKYWVEVSNGVCTSSDTINVSVAAQTLNLGNDTTLCMGQTIMLDAGIANSYIWSTGATSQTINVTTGGQYWVKAFNSDCFRSDTINISFSGIPDCDCVLYMPTAFTPNNDGLNDIFKPAKRGGCEFQKFLIYNRWGKKVFETSDLNKGWDGKCTGLVQDPGVFIWQIFAMKDGVKKLFKGTVMLMK